jgi:hypothetical protein
MDIKQVTEFFERVSQDRDQMRSSSARNPAIPSASICSLITA